MMIPRIEIKIYSAKTWSFDKVINCELTLDGDSLTDTCVIKLPRKVKWDGEETTPIKRGDRIEVKMGYGDEVVLRFSGYVKQVGTKDPVEICCEDEMYQLKQTACKPMAYKAVTVSKLIGDQLPDGMELRVVGEQEIGQYRVTDKNVAELLKRLSDDGVKSFFKLEGEKPVLYAGVLFPKENKKTWKFGTGVNVIKNETEYKRADEIKLLVKATSIMPNNERIELEVGDSDGEVRTVMKYNVTKSELETFAKDELEKMKCDGLTGYIETFGVPEVDKRDAIGLDIKNIETGVYQAKKVTVNFGTNGYKQKIELGGKLR